MPARPSKPSGIRGVLATILSPLATLVGLGTPGGYHATDPRRKILDRGTLIQARSTANQLLNGNLATLRGYCRNLERNNPTARAGVEALRGIVVGSGIALEPDTGDQKTDDLIRAELNAWLDHCGVDGSSIWQLQHLGIGEVVSAGEALWRLVPSDDPKDTVPLRVLPLDAEWLRDDAAGNDDGLTVVAGIKLDRYGRPVSYLVRNPEREGDGAEEVPAGRIIHAFEKRRPVQHRGEPWFAPLIETLIQERDLVDAELKAAVNTASLGIAIESDYHQALDTTEYGDSTDPVEQLKPGSVVRLFPGEKVAPFSHTRPSQQIAPFRQMLRGDIAAALRIPQRFLDRDVSRANYSSMRADMIDTERLIGPVREWYGRQTIGRLYELVLPLICARLGIAVPRATYRLVPDGQPYVDPQKDAQAAITAIQGGLSTYEAEIGKRGGDYRQVWEQAKREQDELAAMGLKVGQPAAAPAAAPAAEAEDEEDDAEDEAEDNEDPQPDEDMAEEREARRHARSLELARATAPVVHVGAPVVNVAPAAAPEVRVDVSPTPIEIVNPAPTVTVRNDVQPTPVEVTNNVTVEPAKPARQMAPIVNVAAPAVTVQNEVVVPARKVIARPKPDGTVEMTPEE